MAKLITGTLDPTRCREELSLAYTHAVVTSGQCTMTVHQVDYEGYDLTIRQRAKHATYDRSQLDVQLKCTSQNVVKDNHIAYPLPVSNYRVLISERVMTPAILVVMVVPNDIGDWLVHSEDSLNVHHCAYWVSLRGMADTKARATKTVRLPRSQQFTREELLKIMRRLGDGNAP